MKNKFTPKKEEIEKMRKEILIEMNKTNNEYRKKKKENFIIIISSILIIILFIKIVFGVVDIPNIFKYPHNKTRFYKVTLNGEAITSEYFLTQKIPIIPYLINLESKYYGQNYISGDDDGSYYKTTDLDKFIIDINSYSCYYKGIQTICKDDKQKMEKNNDTEYTKLTIYRTTNPYEEIYNGKFINDITPYIKDKGVYSITIYAEYSFIETEISFSIKKR